MDSSIQNNVNGDNEERAVSQSNASASNIHDEDPGKVAGAAGPINESMLNRPKNNPLASAPSSIIDATKQA